MKGEPKLTFADWFAGIGGFRLGLERAGFECVCACEIDGKARTVYRRRFPDAGEKIPFFGDSREVDPGDVPDHDLFVAGFPCQSFSVLGKRKGFADPRGTLFFEVLRICEAKKPPFLLLENVKGLLWLDGGETFRSVLLSLSELGYRLQWQVLDGGHCGLPQRRERVFVVGSLGTVPFPEVFPFLEKARFGAEMGEETQYVNTIVAGYDGRGYGSSRPYVLDLRVAGRKAARTPPRRSPVRPLTPLEVERLFGFPDGWTAVPGLSDGDRWRLLGESVMVPLVEMIGKRLMESLEEKGWIGLRERSEAR